MVSFASIGVQFFISSASAYNPYLTSTLRIRISTTCLLVLRGRRQQKTPLVVMTAGLSNNKIQRLHIVLAPPFHMELLGDCVECKLGLKIKVALKREHHPTLNVSHSSVLWVGGELKLKQ
jgi:hypothetical protein